jgi:hypothetical protein
MRDLSHQAGVVAALRDFAVVKYAGFWGDVASAARTQAFGHPLEALKQLREGSLFHPETGLYAKGLPRTLGATAGTLAVPLALTALFAKMSPEGSRGEVAGEMIGRTTGSLLGGPLAGVAGQIGGGMLLSNVGRELGRQFDGSASPRKSEVVAEE